MPFCNVSIKEAQVLSEFAEGRKTSRETDTFAEGSAVDIGTPFLDAVVDVVEAVLLRHALTCVRNKDRSVTMSSEFSASIRGDGILRCRAPEARRMYPFPSLFLHTPRMFVHLHSGQFVISDPTSFSTSDRVNGARGVTCADGAHALSKTYCTSGMPPTPLLFKDACVGADSQSKPDERGAVRNARNRQMQPAPLPYDSFARFPSHLHRNASSVLHNPSLDSARPMVNLSLTPTPINRKAAALVGDKSGRPSSLPSVQEMVQVVLQGEAAMVVTTAPALPDKGVAAGVADTAALGEAPLLFSADATSCVMVACRVTLHEKWQPLIAAATATAAALSKAAVPDVARPAALRSGAGMHRFLSACGRTASAAMAHLDREDGVKEMLHQLVWDSAVPAYLHAVHQHYASWLDTTTCVGEGNDQRNDTASCAKAVMALKSALTRLLVAYAQPTDPTPAHCPLPLLHVDWYVVGSIQMRKSSAPVLEKVFQQFFAASRASTPSTPHVLAEEVCLNSLLTPPTSSETAPPTPCTLNVTHRLREDGVCFWSFNTAFQPWSLESDSSRHYPYPMTWGLLLSVATGHSWPATVHPNTRVYPLPEIRGLSTEEGYRWVTPLVSDARGDARPSSAEVSRPGGLQLVTNAVASSTVARRAKKSAASVSPSLRLWSPLDVCDTPSSGAEPVYSAASRKNVTANNSKPVTTTVTLASYVQTVLTRQDTWWTRVRRCQTTVPVSDDSLSIHVLTTPLLPHKRVLPLILRRRTPLAPPLLAPSKNKQDHKEKKIDNQHDDDDRTTLVHWSGISERRARMLLSRSKETLLNWSTTPHCEPPDFCDHARDQLLWRSRVRPAHVFVKGTDGLYIE
ncbi:hypothetical protein JKF63_07239 [Porcisia hertigi]|uniref:Uncharacterized protein n=1 Tax=Porcisia hertigi TaxID=2761500 RepID=A0A836LL94_9TRYP|nr:hypothetical protein JKF63_07239 [Porcisia hertigi]